MSTYLLNKQKTTTLEKILYGLGGVGMNLCWTFMMMFITVYYTNSAGIAAGVVGTFMLVSRLLDGVSDIVFAALMQKVHFKMGKVRPWFLIIAPVLGISLVLCFNVPAGWSASAKGIYAFITYAFTAAVSYTIVNLAFASFLPLISGDEDDRTKTSSVGNFIIMVGMMVMNYATPLLLALRGCENSQKAWTMISIIYAVLCTIFVAMISLIKEKEIVTAEAEEEIKAAEKQLTFTQALKYVLGNRYSWLLLAIFLFYYMLSGSTGGVIYYYFLYVIGDPTQYGNCSVAGSIALMIAITLTPVCFKKIGKRKTLIYSMVLIALSSLMVYLAPQNIALIICSTIIRQFAQAPITVATFVLVADVTTYIMKKNHVQISGYVAMTSSIGTKIGTGLGSAIVGWGLALSQFNAQAVVQSKMAISGITFMFSGLGAILAIIIAILISFWKIEAAIENIDAKQEEEI